MNVQPHAQEQTILRIIPRLEIAVLRFVHSLNILEILELRSVSIIVMEIGLLIHILAQNVIVLISVVEGILEFSQAIDFVFRYVRMKLGVNGWI